MDSRCPPSYIEHSPEASIKDTNEIISYIRSLNSTRIYPVVTPRFAISCSSELLSGLGHLVRADTSLTIQTHISENLDEIELTKKCFPLSTSYADVYDSFGLLRHNTILAHAVHLTDQEIALIKQRESGISHCPTSNLNLRSGCANIGKYLDLGIKASPESELVKLSDSHFQGRVGNGLLRGILAFNIDCYSTCEHCLEDNCYANTPIAFVE